MKTNSNFQLILSISFTIISIAGMLIVGFASYFTFYRSVMDTTAKDQKQILEQVNLNLDNYLRNMMKISDTVYFRVIKNRNMAKESIAEETSLLYDVNRDKLVSIALFAESGEVLSAIPLSTLKPNIDVTEQSWFIKAREQIENLHFSTPHVQNIFQNTDYRYNWVVSLSRTVELTFDRETKYGVLLVDMNFSGIEQICRRVSLGNNGYIYIADNNGEIIYHPKQQLIYAGLVSENNTNATKYKDGSHYDEFNGKSRFITTKTLGYTGWKIICVSYVDELAPYSEITLFFILILLFAISLMIFINYYVSSRIANPIMVLEQSLKEIDRGRLDIEIEASGSYEVRHLGQAINTMLAQIRRLMDEIVTEHELKRKSELDALQSQINPHFLYNTMDSIVWMIESGNFKQASAMITALSRFFRISISKGRNIIPVSDELEHVRNYLEIQEIRFKDQFIYKIEAEPGVLNMGTIKLIVQPIVENAINHGVASMDGEGKIFIKAYIKDIDMFIDIIDNGLGMVDEQIETLLKSPLAKRSSGSGIGIYNVHERIRLYYGEQYGLIINSEPDEGTKVTIHLPAIVYSEMGGAM